MEFLLPWVMEQKIILKGPRNDRSVHDLQPEARYSLTFLGGLENETGNLTMQICCLALHLALLRVHVLRAYCHL